MYTLRSYQVNANVDLYKWWITHPRQKPIVVLPTGAGKSLVIADLCKKLFSTWADQNPRTLVIVPSKELAQQNGEKLRSILPKDISLGYHSASLNKAELETDVIVSTIGSIYKKAHLFGNIKCVLIDECHLVKNKTAGRYRQFLSDLERYCNFAVAGYTATPFDGKGVWLTSGDDPFFHGIAHETSMKTLIEENFLSPLVLPINTLVTQINTSQIKKSGGDFNVRDLADKTDEYLQSIVDESMRVAADRKKWIAFTPTVKNANDLSELYKARGLSSVVVCGSTPMADRAQHIDDFKAGKIRCLVTVLALAIGFDVPDVDCIIWARSTTSPVLFVQGAGRGLRIAPGKTNCLWLDFTDTTDRLGAIDSIRGRKKNKKIEDIGAPCIICGNCGARVVPASTVTCPECGHTMREDNEASEAEISNAAILSCNEIYDVDKVLYSHHVTKAGIPAMKVTYVAGLRRFSEWVNIEHPKAQYHALKWWNERTQYLIDQDNISDDILREMRFESVRDGGVVEALKVSDRLQIPSVIVVDNSGQYPKIVKSILD